MCFILLFSCFYSTNGYSQDISFLLQPRQRHVTVAWLNEHINQRLCKDDFATFIGLFDIPVLQNMSSRPNSLDQFCINFASAKTIATQALPRNEDTIVAAQQAVKPMRAPSTRRKNTIKRMPTVNKGGDVEEQDREECRFGPQVREL